MASFSPGNDPRRKEWQHLFRRNLRTQLRELVILESAAFDSQTISFDSGNVIVGSHGTGKTLLLRLIEAVFGYTPRIPPFVGAKNSYQDSTVPLVGKVLARMVVNGVEIEREVDLSNYDEERSNSWSDVPLPEGYPSLLSSVVLADEFGFYFQEFRYARTRIRESRKLRSTDLGYLRNILGRAYDEVELSTIIVDRGFHEMDDLTGPYVRVKLGTQAIDSAQLSLGELWTFRSIWEQDRVGSGCLVMFDEPESFLAVKAHRPFVDRVARHAVARESQLLISTHSPNVLMRFPLQHVRMCVRAPGGKIRIVQPDSFEKIGNSIGLEAPVDTVILVEDEAAKALVIAILDALGISTASFDVIPAGGVADVIAGVRSMDRSTKLRVFGVLDADQSGKQSNLNNILLLPGSADPEAELLNVAATGARELSSRIARSADSILIAVDNCSFLDHQYQLTALAREIGINTQHLLGVLVMMWMEQPSIREQAEALGSKLRASA